MRLYFIVSLSFSYDCCVNSKSWYYPKLLPRLLSMPQKNSCRVTTDHYLTFIFGPKKLIVRKRKCRKFCFANEYFQFSNFVLLAHPGYTDFCFRGIHEGRAADPSAGGPGKTGQNRPCRGEGGLRSSDVRILENCTQSFPFFSVKNHIRAECLCFLLL